MIKIFAVGIETMNKLKINDFKNIIVADGNAKSLVSVVLKNTSEYENGIWLSGKDKSLDIKGILEKKNRNLLSKTVYKTIPISLIEKKVKEKLINAKNCIFLILSSRNILIAKNILNQHHLFEIVNNKSKIIVNSKKVSLIAKESGWLNVIICQKSFTKEILDYIVKQIYI